MAQFGLVGLLVLVAVALLAAWRLRHDAQRDAVRDARDRAVALADGIVAPLVTDALVAGDPAAIAEMDRVARQLVVRDPVTRLKVWRMDGTIVYADDRRLVGRTFAIEDEALEAAARGESYADITDLADPENVLEQGDGALLEVYRPIVSVSGQPMLYEHYQRLSAVTRSADRIWTRAAPLLLGSMLVLQLMQIPLAVSLARRVRAAQRQRADLLQQALDASDIERRRIARDLHDGIVQDLIGVSYAVGSLTQDPAMAAAPGVLDTLGEVRNGTQRSIRGLRTLLVDIYPPTLEQGDLAAALDDLVAPYQAKGIEAAVHVALGSPLEASLQALVYRTVREAMSNVARHAGATHVEVRLVDVPGGFELTVRDDGRGFDPAVLSASPDRGHLGILLLRDLAAHAGGTILLDSAPARGTVLTLRAPR